jgi:hypothetical protein
MTSIVTNTGFANITSAWVAYATSMHWLGWGTGSGQTATSNALATASAEARTVGSTSQVTTTVTNDTFQVTGTIVATGSRAITEVGAFDALTSGNMGIYGDFSVINLATNDSIAFTVKVKFS